MPSGTTSPALRTYDNTRRCPVCTDNCWWTRCAHCGTKLSTHDFTPEESRLFATDGERRRPHRCKAKP